MKEVRCICLIVKLMKCLYFMKKIILVAFFAVLGCMGVRCLCHKKCTLKKLKKMF